MSLSADLEVQQGNFNLRAELTVPDGKVLAVLGPNGAGKSTLLRALAGFTPLTSGRVMRGDVVWEDVATRKRVGVEHRNVGVVFQDYLLFAHMSALENVAFGLRSRGTDKHTARQTAHQWLQRYELADFADRRPTALSGGQQQRVALARALAPAPNLVLLDEPLSALDAGTKARVRTELRGHLSGYTGPSVLVTHDPIEAMVVADAMVVLENGRVVQQGTPSEVAAQPRTDYVARLVGLNLLRGRADGTTLDLPDGPTWTLPHAHQGEVFVAVRPSTVSLSLREPEDASPRNVWPATITGLEVLGDVVRVATNGPPPILVDITATALAELKLGAGQRVWLSVKASALDVYPA